MPQQLVPTPLEASLVFVRLVTQELELTVPLSAIVPLPLATNTQHAPPLAPDTRAFVTMDTPETDTRANLIVTYQMMIVPILLLPIMAPAIRTQFVFLNTLVSCVFVRLDIWVMEPPVLM
jgi:hypothetical protein